jgi:1-deoxy-D-xylulose-5-phosphate reductoisomerase
MRGEGLVILGATGSIGENTLAVVAANPGRFPVVALTAHSDDERLFAQCVEHRPAFAVLVDEGAAARLRERVRDAGLAVEVLAGARALVEVVELPEVGRVMAAIVGAAGLMPTLAAARAGRQVLLANKESLVMAGHLLLQAVAEGGGELVPIDSEHNAIFQCLPDGGTGREGVRRLILTASGGPFLETPLERLATVTPDEACAHPNWRMGRKISVDSATMMNKALEVIEAHWLFALAPDRIRVVIHPQSIIHSMVVCRDASVLAQLGTPDMRVPIAYGLGWPDRIDAGAPTLDFLALQALTFEPADRARFPGLYLAWDALRAPSGSPAVLNAANEEAVAAFLAGTIRFPQIHRVNAQTVDTLAGRIGPIAVIDDLYALDERARRTARAIIRELAA